VVKARSGGLDGVERALRDVRLLVLDFDGVMTDNRVLVGEDGRESVWCHRGDGWGIARLREAGLEVVVLSTEANPVVAARCRKLGIEAIQDCADKRSALERLAASRGVDRSRTAYVGNDVNDLGCLGWAGVPIVVADAEPEALRRAVAVTRRRGGDGAVREVADAILRSRGAVPISRAHRKGERRGNS
jgi:YrbI family 3-deoxy-D-manno-octulosonate 8-phosphate phosphatase